jgi:hypothetical protein
MHPRFFLSGAVLAAATTFSFAESPAVNTPPGPVTMVDLTNAAPETPAPPQANAKSAPGAASPNGSNGTTAGGKPVTKAPNTPAPKTPNPNAAPPPPATVASTTAPAQGTPPKKPASILDNYLADLNDALKLSAQEKQTIQNDYLADGPALKNILNDPALSPLQQARQVADLRQKRDAKIDTLLEDPQRRHDFYEVEARYRVALTESAADGEVAPAQPSPAAPPGTKPAPAGPATSAL